MAPGSGLLRWPLAVSLAAHAAVVAAVVAFEAMAPEPPPRPVELVMTALPTSMEALSMRAEDAAAAPPEAVRPVDTSEAARPV
ncbi:MAG: hypothetical protein IT561_18155, partial [Alphaproteobacteria bacterium]|nr:hypothetical protein [Alphaproteobacteria bacterium]